MGDTGVIPTDIRKKLNPLNEPNGFMGANSSVVSDDVAESIDEFEETALGRATARHQSLFYEVDGEVLEEGAGGGETAYNTKLFPITNLRLYKNFAGPWDGRRKADALKITTDYTVNVSTGAITLITALQADETLIATYNHTALNKCKLFRRIVKDLVAAEWARRLYADDETFGRYQEWEKQAYFDITKMKAKGDERLGIKMFDDIKLVNETMVARLVADPVDVSGGML